MRLTTVILIASLLQVSAATFGQRITLNEPNASLKVVLKEIRRQSGYDIFYDNKIILNTQRVSVAVTNATLEEALNNAFKGLDLKYDIDGKTVSITKKDEPSFLNKLVSADITIFGTVLNENGESLSGATIKIKGSNNVVRTNDQGFFTIQVPDKNAILEVTYIGYEKQEIPVGNNTKLNVMLKTELGALSEVVVVGYGKQNKALITSSVSSVTGSELVKVPAPNITQSLAGRLPGLIAYNTSGRPGADNATLLIRGLSTSGDNTPLIVVDGVVRSNFSNVQVISLTGTNGFTNVNALSYIDPNDIESISILKDAAATAIYGARAANGAILVTTKRGTEGTTSISYTGNFGVQDAVQLVKSLDSYTTAQMWNVAWQNEGLFAPNYVGARGYNDAALAAIKNGTDPNRFANTDWYGAIYGNSVFQQSHNVSVNGGNTRSRYFVSAGYFDQNGFYTGTDLKRYNIRTNLDGKIFNVLDFTLNISGRKENNTNTPSDPSANALRYSPLTPIQFPNGTYPYDARFVGNPYLVSKGYGGYNNTNNTDFESSATLTYKVPFLSGLSVKGLFSYDTYYIESKAFSKPYTAYTLNDDNSFTIPQSLLNSKPSLTQGYNQYQSITSEISLNYSHSFKNHHFDGLLVYTETRNSGQNLTGGRINFSSAILDELSLGSSTGLTNSGTGLQNARRGIVSRLGYNYKEKYIFEFDARYDGSDLFPPGQRYGFFPAVAVGWRLSEEPFIKNNFSFVNNLKIRGSWGKAGNDRAAAFQYLNAYTIPSSPAYGFGGGTGQILLPGVIANPSFTWEKATTTDVGLDANFWNNLLGVSADYFYKRTSNILTSNSSVPSIIGGTLPVGNYGIVDNNGLEIQLTHQNKIGKFSYYINPNITYYHNKVIYYPEPASTPESYRLTGKQVQPTAAFGYLADGLYQNQAEITNGPTPLYATTKPGDIKYVDITGDGKITADDQKFITGGIVPSTVFGLNFGASYNNFDLTVFFQGVTGIKVVIPTSLTQNSGFPSYFPFQQNYWTPDNSNATYPRLTISTRNNSDQSTYWVRDGSYLRLKNFELGYTLPKTWLKKLDITNTRVFVSGTNLLTFSHLNNIMDPETRATNYPLVRVFNAGISVKF